MKRPQRQKAPTKTRRKKEPAPGPKPLICGHCRQPSLLKDTTKKRPFWVCVNILCPSKQKQVRRLGTTIII